MNRNLAAALFRLTNTIVATFFTFVLFQNAFRQWETLSLAAVMTRFGVDGASEVYGSRILVQPEHSRAFLATLTPSCSSLGAIVAFAAIAIFMLHAPVVRRIIAVASAAVLVLVANFVRIGLAIVVGLRWGSHAMVVFHDWIGTVLGVISILAGFTVFVSALLPSNKQLLAGIRES